MSTKWFDKGFDSLDKIPNYQRQNRFWLKPAEEKEIIILNDQPFTFWEHQVTIYGDFRNYFTCRKNLNEECPLCQAKAKRYYVGIFSIIEIAEWEKDGEIFKNPVKIMAVKTKSLKLLRRHAEKDRIKNGLFTVGRTDKKSATSGDFFEFNKKVDPLEYNKDAKVHDFQEMFKPMGFEELSVIAKDMEPDKFSSSASGGSSDWDSSDDEDDDVPF